MQGSPYYHELTGKYITAFGAMFTDIKIQRFDKNKNVAQTVKVPITYGPREKFYEINSSDPDKNRKYKYQAPILAYELTGIQYDADRQQIHTHNINNYNGSNSQGYQRVLKPIPYILTFRMVVIANSGEDAHKIMEQIVPNFRPEYNLTIFPMEEFPNLSIDTPVIMDEEISYSDDWMRGDIKDQRRVEWEFTFRMKVLYWGATNRGKIIKIVTVNLYAAEQSANSSPDVVITAQPGLTANGTPTTKLEETIPYQQIDPDDDYGYIVTIEEPKLR